MDYNLKVEDTMSSKLFAILTILVIGVGSFLIGKFLTGSKWKKKYLDAEKQKKLLEKRNISVTTSLKETKEKEQNVRKKNRELIASNNSKDEILKDLKKEIKIKSATSTHSDESYNELLIELNAEKKKVIALEAQLAKSIIPSKKRVSNSTFKSFDNDAIGTKKVLRVPEND